MQISHTAPALASAIQQGLSVEITAKGTWHHKNLLLRIVNLFRRIIFGYDEALENAKNLATFFAAPNMVSSGDIKGLSQKDSWDAEAMSSLVSAVKASLRHSVEKEEARIASLADRRNQMTASVNESERVEVVELNRKIFSVKEWSHRYAAACLDRALLTQKYLGENQENIDKVNPNEADEDWLKGELDQWLAHQYPVIDYPDCGGAFAEIYRACQYQDFISAARKNRALLELFLSSVFKNQSNIDVFIQAPEVQTELEKTFLYKRLQRSANGGLLLSQLQNHEGKPIKDVTLRINNKQQSIIDPSSTVEIAEGIERTVSHVFKECKAQNSRFIDQEYLWRDGLTQFDGRLLEFDLNQEEWWTHLPAMFQPMTKEQISAAYGVSLEGDEKYALFVTRGSRTVPNMSIEDCHGWCNIIFPSNERGMYTVIAPGKYADWFPNSLREKGMHTFGTFRGQITLADFSEFISNRERISVPVSCLTKGEFLRAMGFLKTKLTDSREGNMVFQAQGDDCANFVQELSDHLWPGKFNLFDLCFEELSLPATLRWILQLRPLFSTPQGWQRFRRGFCCLFGGMRGYRMRNGTVVRLKDFQKWRDGFLAVPTALWRHRDRILENYRASIAM